ncbi:hypothetical protein FN846DRAFT_441001 [Sphaerosporella brunnea]|uniref:Uncharacterized protein n=1 Tax=Sphaerosporella brunnea TaxID=1250544 RepID=A0A5J5F4C9_9PEZI|nr:hypothetical protein FN846DRAFT_441001 [Sphaerosporella brunnea]
MSLYYYTSSCRNWVDSLKMLFIRDHSASSLESPPNFWSCSMGEAGIPSAQRGETDKFTVQLNTCIYFQRRRVCGTNCSTKCIKLVTNSRLHHSDYGIPEGMAKGCTDCGMMLSIIRPARAYRQENSIASLCHPLHQHLLSGQHCQSSINSLSPACAPSVHTRRGPTYDSPPLASSSPRQSSSALARQAVHACQRDVHPSADDAHHDVLLPQSQSAPFPKKCRLPDLRTVRETHLPPCPAVHVSSLHAAAARDAYSGKSSPRR